MNKVLAARNGLTEEDFQPHDITGDAIAELAEIIAEKDACIAELAEMIGGNDNG